MLDSSTAQQLLNNCADDNSEHPGYRLEWENKEHRLRLIDNIQPSA